MKKMSFKKYSVYVCIRVQQFSLPSFLKLKKCVHLSLLVLCLQVQQSQRKSSGTDLSRLRTTRIILFLNLGSSHQLFGLQHIYSVCDREHSSSSSIHMIYLIRHLFSGTHASIWDAAVSRLLHIFRWGTLTQHVILFVRGIVGYRM